MSKTLTAELKRFAREQGADLVGIGDMRRFEGAPRDCDPRYIMPEATAMVGLGFRIHRGALRGIEEGAHFGSYPALCYANVNDVHAPVVLRQVGSFLEDHGHEAFLFGNSIVRYGTNAGRPVAADKPRPDVFLHFRIAAYICGMGEIGWSKVFLTPEFGPRQRFAFIITDAPLEFDPIYAGEKLCDRCGRCVSECPARAIPREQAVRVAVAGQTVEWGRLHEKRCGIGWQAAIPELNPFADAKAAEFMRSVFQDERPAEEQDGELWPASNELKELLPYSRNGWNFFLHPGAICGGRGCIRACMIHLEERGVLKNKFAAKFRRRKPWKVEPAV